MKKPSGFVHRAIQSVNRYCAKQINSKFFLAQIFGYTLSMFFKLNLFVFGLLLPGALITSLTLLSFFILTPIIGPLSGLVGLGISLVLTVSYLNAISPLLKDVFEPNANKMPEIEAANLDSKALKESIAPPKKLTIQNQEPLRAVENYVLPPAKVSRVSVFKQYAEEEKIIEPADALSLNLP